MEFTDKTVNVFTHDTHHWPILIIFFLPSFSQYLERSSRHYLVIITCKFTDSIIIFQLTVPQCLFSHTLKRLSRCWNPTTSGWLEKWIHTRPKLIIFLIRHVCKTLIETFCECLSHSDRTWSSSVRSKDLIIQGYNICRIGMLSLFFFRVCLDCLYKNIFFIWFIRKIS
jgi:hypothetical protein